MIYVENYQVYLRMAMMFTDFPIGSGCEPHVLLEICKYHWQLKVNWKNSKKRSDLPNIKY